MSMERKNREGRTAQKKPGPGRKWTKQRVGKMAVTVLLVLVTVIFLLAALGTVAHAAGLVDDTVSDANEYSKYPLNNYQLDFYVDTGWDWLPWNWLDGIGKQVMYGLYAITNFIWTISLYLSNATGYVIQEAYNLDFISATADSIGKNMQTLAGVTPSGLSPEGFYIGFLMLLILVMGIYVAYTGLLKRETTKAVHAIVNFVAVFLLSGAFIAYAPDYIGKINDFSADISNASLSLGTKIVLPDSESKGRDSVDLIRDSLFSIQVKQPWLLLQFDSTDVDSIGADRVEDLLAASPDENNGEDREELVKEEIEDRDNTNLTVTKTINRLGTAFFLFLFNIGISVFVFLLTGIMIFSQVLFIIYAMFLPVSFILSMVPTFEGMSKRAVTKLFNTILTRAGITLIITIAFSISTMLYTLSADYPFFLIAFLQVVTFAGIYFKLGDLMSMFSLQSGDSQSMGSRVMRRPRMLMQAHMHRLQHKLGRSVAALGAGDAASKTSGKSGAAYASGASASRASRTTRADHARPDGQAAADTEEKAPFGRRAGQAAGAFLDTKDKMMDTAAGLKEQAKDLPVNAKYALYHGKKQVSEQVSEGVRSFTSGAAQTRAARVQGRKEKAGQRRQTIAERREEMEQAARKKRRTETTAEPWGTISPVYERPAVSTPREKTGGPMESRQVQTDRDTERAAIAGTPMERPLVSAVKEAADTPAMEEGQTAKMETPPVRAERQIIKTDSLSGRQAVSGGSSHPSRPRQKAAAPASSEQEPRRPSIRERGSTIKQESAGKETTRTADNGKKGEKK